MTCLNDNVLVIFGFSIKLISPVSAFLMWRLESLKRICGLHYTHWPGSRCSVNTYCRELFWTKWFFIIPQSLGNTHAHHSPPERQYNAGVRMWTWQTGFRSFLVCLFVFEYVCIGFREEGKRRKRNISVRGKHPSDQQTVGAWDAALNQPGPILVLFKLCDIRQVS